ncbi:hypothetical protein Ddc_12429 [Ditylenchus destructor]|nr:hypothetical protein Ddc_12429 [Ditylenchus destructor]
MDLECRLCNGNKIATSFDNLDGLQAHLFSNHHDGPLDMFQFVCHKCEFKFGTEYRLLRHEQTCGRESRSEEDIEKIRYKLKMNELLEATLKYNMTKHLISGARPANQYNIGTLKTRESPQTQCQTESLGTKIIKSVIPESLENPVSNSRRENRKKNVIPHESSKSFGNLRTVKAEVQDQHCSIDSPTSTQSYVKTSDVEVLGSIEIRKRKASSKPTEHISQNQHCYIDSATSTQSNVKTKPVDVDTSDVEILGSIEIRKRKASSKPTEHISQRSRGIAHQNVNSAGESINLRHAKQAKKNLSTSNAQSKTVDEIPLLNQFILGSANVNEKQILRFKSARDQDETMATLTSTDANWSNKSAMGLHQQTSRGEHFNVVKTSPAVMLTNRIYVNGPCLHPEQVDPIAFQKEELSTYFSQFGKIVHVTVSSYEKSMVIFDSCDSAAKCIQQRMQKIRGQDFIIWATTPSEYMKWKLVATGNHNTSHSSSENVPVPNNQIQLPAGLTNRIFVTGPLLNPEQVDPKAFQKEMYRAYFGQFGKVIVVTFSLPKLEAKVGFDNCDSAAICIQQVTHRICGRDFVVCAETPTESMKGKIRAILRQNMSGPSSSSQVHGIDTISKEWGLGQGRCLARQDTRSSNRKFRGLLVAKIHRSIKHNWGR